MSGFVLIESGGAAEVPDVRGFLETAAHLAGAGHDVQLFLIQNGVLRALQGADPCLAALANQPNVAVWADAFSLQTRAVDPRELAPGIRVASMRELLQLLTSDDRKPVWH